MCVYVRVRACVHACICVWMAVWCLDKWVDQYFNVFVTMRIKPEFIHLSLPVPAITAGHRHTLTGIPSCSRVRAQNLSSFHQYFEKPFARTREGGGFYVPWGGGGGEQGV